MTTVVSMHSQPIQSEALVAFVRALLQTAPGSAVVALCFPVFCADTSSGAVVSAWSLFSLAPCKGVACPT